MIYCWIGRINNGLPYEEEKEHNVCVFLNREEALNWIGENLPITMAEGNEEGFLTDNDRNRYNINSGGHRFLETMELKVSWNGE